ncbi:hypothetical protein S83_058140 [Arachis hypogaea]
MYKYVEQLTRQIKRGVESVPETLPNRVLYKLNAPPKSDVPIIEPEMPNGANGLIFGFPMRFRMMAAQFMDFLDKTGPL